MKSTASHAYQNHKDVANPFEFSLSCRCLEATGSFMLIQKFLKKWWESMKEQLALGNWETG